MNRPGLRYHYEQLIGIRCRACAYCTEQSRDFAWSRCVNPKCREQGRWHRFAVIRGPSVKARFGVGA